METVSHVLKFLFVLLEVVLLFNLLIVVHELGHFLAARWRGLVVEQFAVWFGKPLWKRTYHGVVYSLGSIPFGGFVKLPQMAPMDAIEGSSDTPQEALPTAAPLDKIIVALAGPLFSLGLAFVFAVIVWGVKRPQNEAEANTVIGYVVPDSPAATAPCTTAGVPAGLHPGDNILSIDGHKVGRFAGMTKSVVWYVARSENETIAFEVRRGDQTLTFLPKPLIQKSEGFWQRSGLRQVLIEPAYESIVKTVKPGSPAATAGLRENDVVEAVNGQKLWNPLAFDEAERDNYGKPLALTVQRGRETLPLTLPAMPLTIDAVTPGSPADRAGLKPHDELLAINGEPLTRFSDLSAAAQASANQPIRLTVSSAGQERQVSVVPLKPENADTRDESRPMIGIAHEDNLDGIGWVGGGKTKLVSQDPVDQIEDSVSGIFNTVGAVLAPKSKIGFQHLGGPIMIGQTYFFLLSSEEGWRLALWFSVVLNVNLALLNMLPIPVLDGGHILLALIEAVRRKPANLRVLEVVQTACFIVIASYMLFVTFFDVGALASPGQGRHKLTFPSPTPAAKN